MSDDFQLNVIHVDVPLGYGTRRMVDVNMAMNLIKRKCVLSGIKDWSIGDDRDDNIHCFAYSLAVVVRLLEYPYKSVRQWCEGSTRVRAAVLDYHTRAEVPPGPVSPHHYQQFQNILPDGVRLVIVDAIQSRGLLYKGESGYKVVCLLYYNQHYFPLKNLHTWFAQPYYCVDCEVTARSKKSHKCKGNFVCPRCLTQRCLNLPKLPKYCKKCCGMFSNPECLQEHTTSGVCERSSTCTECSRWFPSDVVQHNCTTLICPYCKKNHSDKDACFITPSVGKDSARWRIVTYDFESYQEQSGPDQEEKRHRVNYAVAMSVCSDCRDDFCNTCSEVHHFTGLNGGDALRDFCLWATSNPLNHNTTFIAHNASGYDSHFILEYLVGEGNSPKLIMQGGKILSMTISGTKTRFIDSLSFLSMPLNDFSKTFDLPDITKGTFPHLFNTPDNYEYTGPLPALHYYSPDSLKEPARTKLLEWHSLHRHDHFVFADELASYCEADVRLLRAGCVKFRSSFISSTGVDPFLQVTIASACMKVFRRHHMPAQTIGE